MHFEFLDNSVPRGEPPRTVAFGWNGVVNILDVKCLIDIERYRKIDVDATRPEDVYGDPQAMAAERNTAFLVQCVRTLPVVTFAERDSGRLYARLEGGRLAWTDPALLARALADPTTRAGLRAAAPDIETFVNSGRHEPRVLRGDRYHTLGRWGEAQPG